MGGHSISSTRRYTEGEVTSPGHAIRSPFCGYNIRVISVCLPGKNSVKNRNDLFRVEWDVAAVKPTQLTGFKVLWPKNLVVSIS